jgi:hypothetical protein
MQRRAILVFAAFLGCVKGAQDTPAPPNTPLTRAQHDKHFPIATGNHAVDCNACHGKADTFRAFDCLGCHTAPATTPRHAMVAGFVFASPSCYACHPRGTATTGTASDGGSNSNHAAFFPIDASAKHAFGVVATSCADCHADATDRTKIDCSRCHVQPLMEAKHTLVGGFVFTAGDGLKTSALCLRCHADAQVNRVGAHAPFNIAPPARHSVAQGTNGDCLLCHASARSDKPFGADFTKKDCAGCHTEQKDKIVSRHGPVDGFAPDTASCLSCHPKGEAAAPPAAHAGIFPIGAASKHAFGTVAKSCGDCHASATDRKVIDCTGCHNDVSAATSISSKHTTVGGFTFTASAPVPTSAQCLRCHADAVVPVRVAQHLPFHVLPPYKHNYTNAASGKCLTCHVAARADKPFGQDFTQKNCLGCHLRPVTDAFHSGFSGYGYATATCLNCHANGARQ